MKNNNVDKIIYNAPTVKESIKLASETPQEETELMLLQEALQDEDYRKWKRKNPGGSFKDYLEDFKPKRIKLSNGGSVEKYADLIDAYEKGIDVMKNETLTEYIKRIKASEKD
jgi:Zn-dependent M32 family carboxypeptidase|tara:strand:- start:52 stop:390 length:339 start_codon:yes stop_codon:yes gene_type:complete